MASSVSSQRVVLGMATGWPAAVNGRQAIGKGRELPSRRVGGPPQSGAMRFGLLGPLSVTGEDGPIAIGAPKQRALLAALLLWHREEAVTADRLVDVLWGEEPPATAFKALQVHVSQLRRALGPGNGIVTRGAGYAIEVAPGALDLDRFQALRRAAAAAG